MALLSSLISSIASAVMYWMTPVFIRKHRGGKPAVFLMILLTNIWCYVEIQMIRSWGVGDYMMVAVGDTIMCMIIALSCYGSFFKNLVVFYACCYFQQITFLILISVTGLDHYLDDYFNGGEVRNISAVILLCGSLAAALITVILFRMILLRWTDERSSAYRVIGPVLMMFTFINGVLKREASMAPKSALHVIIYTGIGLSLMSVFLFVLYDKLQVRWIKKQHEAIKQMLETDEIVEGYTKQFDEKGITLFVNELTVKTESYMAVAVMLLDDMLKYALKCNTKGIVQAYVREFNGSLIWSVEMLTGREDDARKTDSSEHDDGSKAHDKKRTDRRSYLELKYAVENQGGILSDESFEGGSRLLAVVPMK